MRKFSDIFSDNSPCNWGNLADFQFERLHWKEELENKEFRKKSSFFSNPADHKAILTLSPTSIRSKIAPRVNDYWEKYAWLEKQNGVDCDQQPTPPATPIK